MKSRVKRAANRKTLVIVSLLALVTLILFRQFVFLGRVPIAFDFGVFNFQPWKLDAESSFQFVPPAIGHDDIRIFYPQRKFITDSLKRSIIPHWNPFEFTGNIALANSQTAVFYPPFFLFLMLPQQLAWSLLSLVIPFLAGLGMFLFLRVLTKDEWSAFFGALSFAFSSTLLMRAQDGLVAGHSIVWLPWAMWGMEKFLSGDKRGLIATGISLAFSMLAGWFQFTFYVFAVVLIYALLRLLLEKPKRLTVLVPILCLYVFVLAVTAFHWLPALEAFQYSPRGMLGTPQEFLSEHLMPVYHLSTLLIPTFFGHLAQGTYFGASEYKEGLLALGTIPFLVAIAGLIAVKKHTPAKIFLGLLVGSLVLMLKTPLAAALIKLNLPVISTFLPNRTAMIAVFCLSALSAFGFYHLRRGEFQILKRLSGLTMIIFVLLYCVIAALYFYEKIVIDFTGWQSLFELGLERYVRVSVAESLVPFLLVFLLWRMLSFAKRKTRLVLIVLMLATISEQIVRGNRDLYFSNSSNEFPQNPIFTYLKENTASDYSRFISLSYSKIPSDVATYFDLYSPEGVDAMYPIWFAQLSGFYQGTGKNLDEFSRIETFFAEAVERKRFRDPQSVNLLSHLGIRYIVVPKDYHDIPPGNAFKKVFAYKWHTVYEYMFALPKAYFVPQARFSNEENLTLTRLFHPLFFSEPEVILTPNIGQTSGYLATNRDLNRKLPIWQSTLTLDPYVFAKKSFMDAKKNPVKVTQYSNNQVALNAELSEAGYVIISDAYFPGWQATIDGNPTTVYRANQAFRAVAVPAGLHIIVFHYVPTAFYRGIVLSILALALAAGTGSIYLIRRSRRKAAL